ncbi:unnamed protein product [Paramecium pentaurelia]|uniref:Uncharacterized protein n=1 Tax=Paramecium pentaurelia TaxID=43138 RepID=A0A8S1YC03_9CILI|nr:unnamed protein product [Paramecium pentaurelia]
MLKKYLSSYYSNEQIRSKKINLKPKLDFQGFTKAKFINQDLTQRTIDYSSPKIQLNFGSIEHQHSKIIKPQTKQTNLSLYAQQILSKNNNQSSIDNTPKKGLDLLITKRDEAYKYRSVSQTQRNQLIKRQSSEEKCKSSERIKVIDVFNQSPKHNKQPTSYQTYITSKEILKVKLKQQQQNLQSKSSKISIHINNAQQQSIKQPISSRLNESRDILSQMRRNSINTQKLNNNPDREGVITQKKKYFFNSPQNNDSIGFEHDSKSNLQVARNLKIELEKVDNENILELLLLSTQELNNKFNKKSQLIRNESEEKIPLKIRVRAGNKFPKDFFQ